MKFETKDHGPKHLRKLFAQVAPGEFFYWGGWEYFCQDEYTLIRLADFMVEQWDKDRLAREVTMLAPPDWDQWRQAVKQHFKPKMVEPESIHVVDMEPGQVFVLPILLDGVVNGRYIRGDHGAMTRLSDGKVFSSNGSVEGIPINGKFVEEDQPQ